MLADCLIREQITTATHLRAQLIHVSLYYYATRPIAVVLQTSSSTSNAA